MADLGEGPGGAAALILGIKRKKKPTEGRKAGRAGKTKPPPSPSPLGRCWICPLRADPTFFKVLIMNR